MTGRGTLTAILIATVAVGGWGFVHYNHFGSNRVAGISVVKGDETPPTVSAITGSAGQTASRPNTGLRGVDLADSPEHRIFTGLPDLAAAPDVEDKVRLVVQSRNPALEIDSISCRESGLCEVVAHVRKGMSPQATNSALSQLDSDTYQQGIAGAGLLLVSLNVDANGGGEVYVSQYLRLTT